MSFFDAIKYLATALTGSFSSSIELLSSSLTEGFKRNIGNLSGSFANQIGNIVSSLTAGLSNIASIYGHKLDALRGAIGPKLSSIASSLNVNLLSVWSTLQSTRKVLNNTLGGVIPSALLGMQDSLLGALSTGFSNVGGQLAQLASLLGASLPSLATSFSGGLSQISDVLNRIADGATSSASGILQIPQALVSIGNELGELGDAFGGFVDVLRDLPSVVPGFLSDGLFEFAKKLYEGLGDLQRQISNLKLGLELSAHPDIGKMLIEAMVEFIENMYKWVLENVGKPVFEILFKPMKDIIEAATGISHTPKHARPYVDIAKLFNVSMFEIMEWAVGGVGEINYRNAKALADRMILLSSLTVIPRLLWMIVGDTIRMLINLRVLGSGLGRTMLGILDLGRAIQDLFLRAWGMPWIMTDLYRETVKQNIGKVIATYYNYKFRLKSLPISTWLRLHRRGVIDDEQASWILAHAGLTDFKIQKLLQANWQPLPRTFVEELYSSRMITEEMARYMLRRLGYSTYEQNFILAKAFKEISKEDIDNLYEMGFLTDDDLRLWVMKQGYADQYVGLMKELIKARASQNERTRLINRIGTLYGEGFWTREEAKSLITSLGKNEEIADILLDSYALDLELDKLKMRLDILEDYYLKGIMTLDEVEREASKIIKDPEKLELWLEKVQVRKMPYITPTSVIRYTTMLRRLYYEKDKVQAQIDYYQRQLEARERYYQEKIQYIIDKYQKRINDVNRWYEREKARLDREYDTRLRVLREIEDKYIKLSPEEIDTLVARFEEEIKRAPPLRKQYLKFLSVYLKAMRDIPIEEREDWIREEMRKVEVEYRTELEKLEKKRDERIEELTKERDDYLAQVEEQKNRELMTIEHKIEVREKMLEMIEDEINILERMGISLEEAK